jgi:hypothetical protein
LLAVLSARGLAVSSEQKERVLHCQDGALLDRWLLQALSASSTAEVLSAP